MHQPPTPQPTGQKKQAENSLSEFKKNSDSRMIGVVKAGAIVVLQGDNSQQWGTIKLLRLSNLCRQSIRVTAWAPYLHDGKGGHRAEPQLDPPWLTLGSSASCWSSAELWKKKKKHKNKPNHLLSGLKKSEHFRWWAMHQLGVWGAFTFN